MRRFILHTTLFLLLATSLTLQAQTAHTPRLRVRQAQHGFQLSALDVNGGETLIARADHGTYDDALRHNPVFRELTQTIRQNPASPYIGAEVEQTTMNLPPWGQDAPYNLLCPEVDSTQCKVGCVATAMSQVMYYYRYPSRGNGIHTYTDSAGCKQTLTADFGSHQYEWDYMLDSYTPDNYTDRQAQAVALLGSDAGISVDMRYGTDESGARSILQPIALTQYFGYDRGIRQIFRDFYSRSELYSLLIAEIEAGRPILCSGYGSDGGGHAFVIDGYDGQGLFHINWGWDGYADGYYNIDFMTSHQPEWNLFRDRRENGANILQSFTIGIQPQTQAVDSRELHEYAFSHIELIDNADDENPNSARVVVHNLSNVGWNIHTDSVVLALCPLDDATPALILHHFDRIFALEELTDSTYTDTIDIQPFFLTHHFRMVLPPPLPRGSARGKYPLLSPLSPPKGDDGGGLGRGSETFRLLPIYKEPDGTWREARTSRGTPNHLLASIDDSGGISLRTPTEGTAHLRLDDFQMPDTVVRWTAPHFSMTVTNDSPAEYCGRIYIAYELVDSMPVYGMINAVGLYLEPGQTETLDFQYTFIRNRSDHMIVRAFYDVDLFTDSIIMLPVRQEVAIESTATGIDTPRVSSLQGEGENKQGGVASSLKGVKFDLQGRRLPTLPTTKNQIIITEDGKKRSIQNVP